MTTDEKLDAILKRLDRLELIESHLLDLLVPGRKAYARHPAPEPPAILSDRVVTLGDQLGRVEKVLSELSARVHAPSREAPAKAQTWEEAAAAVGRKKTKAKGSSHARG